jgi:CIC family chloride channel protein
VLTETNGKYAGIVLVPAVHGNLVENDEATVPVRDLAEQRSDVLLPTMNARQAVALFDQCESEALAVVSDLISQKVIGLLTESHTLRRYSEELDRNRREVSGEL